ncbi:MAG: glycosyltransferase [bacterium]|nr:glycosyltransferase [bacterium]
MLKFGVVTPARNEEANIGDCLASLRDFIDAGDAVLVVDACSSDQTSAAASMPGVETIRLETSSRGIAVKCGVERLMQVRPRVDAILIAHADMRFQPGSRDRLAHGLMEHPESPGGSFGHRIDDSRAIFRWIERGNSWRASALRLPYGDQAQFFRREALERIGGFPPCDRLEDLELSLRLRRLGRMIDLNHPVTIPSRHWRNGVLRTTLRNWGTLIAYFRSGGNGTAA